MKQSKLHTKTPAEQLRDRLANFEYTTDISRMKKKHIDWKELARLAHSIKKTFTDEELAQYQPLY